ncbi:MAG: hypothetical protein HN742_26865 [Lentisphaerae bacterium]|jgi:hypothetical protein|nr:hypothetical protein [Lentisphaerota bacterium]MBT4818753.1 hypothetical protein [Lentisphaerota bacterium]MBT5606071.1 hypothetical protein [Lentisphaerota bacterium]MBT7057052.1 hypothetical protein [Lentisphaerota bacterium]MBT7845524.1 hypothetical protein [Lentisphaerota bacterium]
MLTLLLKTCGVEALNGPDFMLAELTPEFLDELGRRRALVQRVRNVDPAFDSLAFCAPYSLWFRYFEAQDELLNQASDNGWTVVASELFKLPAQDKDGRGVLVRTETERIVLWRTGFRFTCCLKHAVEPICSMAVEYEDLHAVLTDGLLSPALTEGHQHG